MKKNTMLTIEEDLTRSAKLLGLNLSDIASRAIEQEVALSVAKSLIPRVKNLKLHNIGMFKEFFMSFDEGTNIIYGPHASGKSTILQSLAYSFGHECRPNVRVGSLRGRIEVETFPSKINKNLDLREPDEGVNNIIKRVIKGMSKEDIPFNMLSGGEQRAVLLFGILSVAKPHEAVLLDEPTQFFDKTWTSEFIEMLKETNSQIIIATHNPKFKDELSKISGAKIHELDHPNH